MNKFAGLSLVSLAFSLAALAPAQAADSDDLLTKAVKVPITLTALVSGMAVGTPIAVVHDTISDYSSARTSIANSFGGQSPDVTQYAVADLAALPAGLASGLVNGTYHGVVNAVSNCNEKPFSAESFCMKDSCYTETP